jgi:PAS domain-containing protein
VRNAPITIAVTREEAVALRPWRDETIRVGVRTLILTLLGALTIYALLRQIRRVAAGERALRESEERYALAMEGANEGHWDWDIGNDRLFMSQKMKMLYGLSAESEINSRSAWLEQIVIHPDDRQRFEAPSKTTSRVLRLGMTANIASVNPTAIGIGCMRAAAACATRRASRSGSWARPSM